MLTFFDSQNQPVTLLKELGRGGEGTVYSTADESLVAKIYYEEISREKREKLAWMAACKNNQLSKTAAWVAEILKDKPDGKIVGFLMPKIKAKEIHELYAPKSRRIHFPQATWHFLVHAAANLARAFHNLHRDGHVMGDVNHGNCVVLADGTIKLIDCDSYSIKTGNARYPCEVGVTTHIPPELQGKNLRGIERTENHDNFGLAVIIFQLLFLGRHPFAGNYLGAQDKNLEEAIREHLFAYGRDAKKKNVVQPPGTLPLAAVSKEVAELFERSFTIDANRPKPRQWIEALENLAENLEQCPLNPGHVFYSKLALCPWCGIEEETGLILFPFIIGKTALTKNYKREYDVRTIEKLVQSFNISALAANPAPPLPVSNFKPTDEIAKERDRLNKMLIRCALVATLIVGVAVFFNFTIFQFLIPILWVLIALSKDSGKEFRKDERAKLTELQGEWNYYEGNYQNQIKTSALEENLAKIRVKITQYVPLQHSAVKQLNPAVGNSQIPATSEKLSQVQNLESEITSLLMKLRSESVQMRRNRQKYIAQISPLANKLAQAKVNVNHLGYNFPFPAVILWAGVLLSIIIPFFKTPVQIVNNEDTAASVVKAEKTGGSTASEPANPVKIPDRKITDIEIAALSEADKESIAKELYKAGNAQYASSKYREAESYLRFGLRFDDKNADLLTFLGIILYQTDRFDESLKYLNQSKAIKPDSTTEFYIGVNYLRLKQFSKAVNLFEQYNKKELPTAMSLYNLGLAYEGLNQHEQAAESFRLAYKQTPLDTEIIYQLAISLSKNKGNDKEIRQLYAELQKLNLTRAAELRKQVGKTVNLETVATEYPSTTVKERPNTPFVLGSKDADPPPPVRQN